MKKDKSITLRTNNEGQKVKRRKKNTIKREE